MGYVNVLETRFEMKMELIVNVLRDFMVIFKKDVLILALKNALLALMIPIVIFVKLPFHRQILATVLLKTQN